MQKQIKNFVLWRIVLKTYFEIWRRKQEVLCLQCSFEYLGFLLLTALFCVTTAWGPQKGWTGNTSPLKGTVTCSWSEEVLAAGWGLPRSLILKNPLNTDLKDPILLFNSKDQNVGRLYPVSSSSTRILVKSCNEVDSKSACSFLSYPTN